MNGQNNGQRRGTAARQPSRSVPPRGASGQDMGRQVYNQPSGQTNRQGGYAGAGRGGVQYTGAQNGAGQYSAPQNYGAQNGGAGSQQIYSTQYQGENYQQEDPAITLRKMELQRRRRAAEAEKIRKEKEARLRRRNIAILAAAAVALIAVIVLVALAIVKAVGSRSGAQLEGGKVTQALDPFAPNGETDEYGDPVSDDVPEGGFDDIPETTAAPETEPPQPTWENYTFNFKSDLSAYEQYMNPEGDEYLTLINISHPLGEDYAPTDLIDVVDTRKDGRPTQQMREYAEKSLEAFLIEARANGFDDVTVTSAYRPYKQQQYSFNNKVAEFSYLGDEAARAEAAKIIQIPGCSEHQSGLCADMHNIAAADVSFAKQDAAVWLADNCYKFGFIVRYPSNKTDITGISYEPWHFRYVGRYHACKMWERGLCLEEYWAQLGKN